MKTIFNRPMERREFLKKMAVLGTAVTFTTCGACEELAEAIRNRPTRRRIRTGSPEVDQAVATYAAAVDQMKNNLNQNTNPRSWLQQASLHGTAAGFNFCQHGTPHFFSWHRAYLFYFEQICQRLTGDQDFGLPYWNWALDKDVPSQFLVPSSSLYEPSRTSTSLFSLSEFTPNNLEDILDNTNFMALSNQIETSPHNTAHWNIGGILGDFDSPRDPLFWLHHCMVDYCWAEWNINRENDNPDDNAWNSETWNHFVDEEGNPAEMTAGITTLMPLLSYQYEESAIGTTPPAKLMAVKNKRAFRKIKDRVEKGGKVNFEIGQHIRIAEGLELNLNEGLQQPTRISIGEIARVIENTKSKDRVFAEVNFAKAPPTNDFLVRVFVNYPEANKDTTTGDIHYAGSFSFFGTSDGDHQGHHGHKPKALVNLTETIRRLRKAGELNNDSKISLKFVSVPFDVDLEQPQARLNLEKIDIIVSRIHTRS